MTRRPLTRRTLLGGAGAALALPWLEAMAPRARAQPDGPPRRLVFVYVPNGVHAPDWRPAGEGSDVALSWTLEPLAPVRDEILVLSGLTHDKARANGDGPGDHARAGATFLTARQARKTAGSDIHVGISVDQVAARHLRHATPLASLELGCEPARQSGGCDSGYSCAYSSSIAWAGPRTPLGKEIRPRLVFERLFAFDDGSLAAETRARRLAARRSILDFVREDAERLAGRLGGADRQKLGEYLDGVRALERRIEAAEAADAGAVEGVAEPPAGIPDRPEHVRLMMDLLVLALRTDATRVVTFMVANEGSNHAHRHLGVGEGHHALSHHGGDAAKIEAIRAIDRWHVTLFAGLVQALAAVEEGEGTLLDHTMLVYGSGIRDGNRHDHGDLPVLLAGRGGGTIDPGRHVVHPRETPMANLYLSLLDRLGIEEATFGDATGRLGGLTA